MTTLKEEIRKYISDGTVKTEAIRKLSLNYKIDKNKLGTMWLIEKQNIEDEKILGKSNRGRHKRAPIILRGKDRINAVIYKAINKYGEENQKLIAMEELAELQQALSKDRRGLKHNVEEEIADVKIMLWQLELMYDNKKIEEWVNKKINRLDRRLKE